MKEDQTNVIDFPLYDNPDIVVLKGKTRSPYRTEKNQLICIGYKRTNCFQLSVQIS